MSLLLKKIMLLTLIHGTTTNSKSGVNKSYAYYMRTMPMVRKQMSTSCQTSVSIAVLSPTIVGSKNMNISQKPLNRTYRSHQHLSSSLLLTMLPSPHSINKIEQSGKQSEKRFYFPFRITKNKNASYSNSVTMPVSSFKVLRVQGKVIRFRI